METYTVNDNLNADCDYIRKRSCYVLVPDVSSYYRTMQTICRDRGMYMAMMGGSEEMDYIRNNILTGIIQRIDTKPVPH